MKDKNKNIKEILMRRVYSNRNFLWAVFALVISGLALTAYIYVTNYSEELSGIFSDIRSRKVFVDNASKYFVSYPKDWQLEKDPHGNTIFENPGNPSESITVAMTDLNKETAIRKALNIKSQQHFTLPGREIYFIQTQTKKGAPDMNVAIIKTALRLYYVTGYSDYFPTFVINMRFF